MVVMGGAATVRGFLDAGLVDELHLHIVPVLLGRGVRLFEDLAAGPVQLETLHALDGAKAAHLAYRVRR